MEGKIKKVIEEVLNERDEKRREQGKRAVLLLILFLIWSMFLGLGYYFIFHGELSNNRLFIWAAGAGQMIWLDIIHEMAFRKEESNGKRRSKRT